MQNIHKCLAAVVVLGLSLTGTAQQQSNPSLKRSAKTQASAPVVPAKLTREQKFVIDTVKMAVALPESDPQDRLRVLSTAADVVLPIDKKMARGFWHEGARIETDLVRIGQTPAVSMMSSGLVDCAAALSFVENLPNNAVLRAEQSLIGAVTSCPKQTLDPVSRKLDAGLDKNIVASRALMAVMAAQGESSAWSQQHFAKMFDALPDPKENAAEAENIAAMYMQMSGSVNKDIAARSGLQLLTWLGKIDDSPLRTLSITITTEAMQKALGAEGYQKALESDVVANTTVQSAGQQREIERPQPESVSILSAMDNRGTDQTEHLRSLPASQRAREAAADGFATGTGGNKQQASKYFDMAFSAADEVWDARTPEQNAAAVVQGSGSAGGFIECAVSGAKTA